MALQKVKPEMKGTTSRWGRRAVIKAAAKKRRRRADLEASKPEPVCTCEGEFIWACGPECDCFHHAPMNRLKL